MTKAVILARVSTLKQEKEGLSLKDIQLPELRDYAVKRDFEVVKEFVFSESADYKIRKRFNEMIDFVKASDDIKVIISYRVDRITRNYRDAVKIDELRLDYGKEIHFVYDHLIITNKTVGRDMQDWDLKVFLAKQFLNRLKEDAINTAKFKLSKNEWPGKAPYGYTNYTRENGSKWIKVVSSEAKIVEKMFEWYSTGAYSMNLIRTELKKVFNVEFSKGRVDHILKNPFYCGTMLYDEQEYLHNYDRIITPGLFDKVQNIKAGYNKKRGYKLAGLPFLYRGLIKCADCGCQITPERKIKKSGKTYHYYHCTQYHGKHGAEWLTEDNLTKQFARMFEKLQIPDCVVDDIVVTLRNSHKDKSEFHKSLLGRYQADYQKYETRIEKMYEDKLDGSITESYYEKKRKEYRTKQKEIEAKTSKLRFADEEYYLTSEYLLKLASKAGKLFESSEDHEKRLLLKVALQNLELKDKKVRYVWKKPFDEIANYASRQAWLLGLDLNQEPSAYTKPTCFQMAWTISSPPFFKKGGVGR
jgi:site-specific DNA recombinase